MYKLEFKALKHPGLQSKIWRSNAFQGGSTFSQASEGPQNGGKTTGMDIPEFRDINGPVLMPK